MKYDISHLDQHGEKVIGPIQSDEALLIYSMIRVIRPKVILEFGFSKGFSSLNFLKAMPDDSAIFSYDISEESEKISETIKDGRFKFIFKGQDAFESADIDNLPVDVVFFDASHNADLNIVTFKKIVKLINNNALILVHDTGSWHNSCNELPGDTTGYYVNGYPFPKGYFLNNKEYIHQQGERKFVNYLREHYPEFQQVHFHSTRTFRHGITLLQNSKPLAI